MRKKLVFVLDLMLSILLVASVYAAESSTQATVNVIIPIIVEIHSPVDGETYFDKNILLNVSVSEQVKLLEYSLNNGRFKRLCKDCDSYSSMVSFNEVGNNLIVRATTYDKNYYYSEAVFYVILPSGPEILDTYPNRMTNGTFGVKYSAADLVSTILEYGPNLEYSTNFACSSGVELWCFGFVDVSEWQGSRIKYRFILSNPYTSSNSRVKRVKVDINSAESMSFWNKILAFFGL